MTYRFLLGNLAALLLAGLARSAPSSDFASLNEVFGISLWADDNLWDDADGDVARRLQWPLESRTGTDASFRLYPRADVRVLGTRPYSLAFYGRDGVADRLSMIFANKGDVEELKAAGVDYKKQIAADAKTIGDRLAKALGPAKAAQFGQGVKTRERVDRWDWNGHTILLAAPRGEYVAVRILPTAEADAAVAARISDAEMSSRLRARVERRPNGDVVLRDIPMVDQGPKGYCVPATWERVLRYMDIPADMYALAMAAQTNVGGGTTTMAMIGAVNELVGRSGRRLVTSGGRITPQSVAKFIDQGLPVMWGIFFVAPLDLEITKRSMRRREVADWPAYKESLKPWRKAARQIRTSRDEAHMCMIVGYNAATGEIAISDSWGPQYRERWITEEEANAISQGDFTIVGR